MKAEDALDDYNGAYDELLREQHDEQVFLANAARVAVAQQPAPQPTSASGQSGLAGMWLGVGPQPHERPWYCASCLAPAMQPSDRANGVCEGCAKRQREARARAVQRADVQALHPQRRRR